MTRPNVVFVFADQMRAQATGYAGDPNAHTPTLDRLASRSLNLTHAVSGHPVCCPYRASLMTGQYPLTHGVYVNDVPLTDEATSLAKCFTDRGYDTAYIGKWHLYGSPDGAYGRREAFIPRGSRQGFDTWKAFECNHNYLNSRYFDGDDPEPKLWDGYDAIAQTREACAYIGDQARSGKPFFLMLSWGPPHDPYDLVPERYRAMFRNREIELRQNVPEANRCEATETLRGYYAHIAALDDCVAMLLAALEDAGITDNTLFIFTSDHGDMHLSQGLRTKHVPWDESIRVPFLLRYPRLLGEEGRELSCVLDAPDIMPTLLGMVGLPVPSTVEGRDVSPILRGERKSGPAEAAFLSVPVDYWMLRMQGLPPYRGLRTVRYTYVRNVHGPWLLYDNEADPYQLQNLCGDHDHADLQDDLEVKLQGWLDRLDDAFLPAEAYLTGTRPGMPNLTHYREVTCPWGTISTPWSGPEDDREKEWNGQAKHQCQ